MARTLNHEVSILNISGVDNDVKDVFTRDMVCNVTETSTVASRPYAAGDTFIWTDRKVYRAKTAISSGATLSAASNGNIEEAGSVENQLGTLKQALTTKFDKSGGTISGNVNVVTSTNSASVSVQDTDGNRAYITANSEGGNIGGAKPNNATRFELDGQPMNGSTGYARLMLGDSSSIARKFFRFNEDGSFVDGKGQNLSDVSYADVTSIISTTYRQAGVVRAYRFGRICILHFNIAFKDVTAPSSGTVMGDALPTEYRPYNFGVPFNFTTPLENANGGYFQVEVDGKLPCYQYPSPGSFFNAIVVYLTAT